MRNRFSAEASLYGIKTGGLCFNQIRPQPKKVVLVSIHIPKKIPQNLAGESCSKLFMGFLGWTFNARQDGKRRNTAAGKSLASDCKQEK